MSDMADLYDNFLEKEHKDPGPKLVYDDEDETSEPEEQQDYTEEEVVEDETEGTPEPSQSESGHEREEEEEEDSERRHDESSSQPPEDSEASDLRGSEDVSGREEEDTSRREEEDTSRREEEEEEEEDPSSNKEGGVSIYLDESSGASLFEDEEYADDGFDGGNDDGIRVRSQEEVEMDREVDENEQQQNKEAIKRQRTFLGYCLIICMLVSLIAGAVLGAILTEDGKSIGEGMGISSSSKDDTGDDEAECPIVDNFDDKAFPIAATYECPEDNVALEIRIVFDANPEETGINVIDTFGINMWQFPPGSFGSFALLLRENIFTLCLTRFQNYTLVLSDSGDNGFVSSLGAPIYGSFRLTYADQLVTTYSGDCDADATECGEFCKCTYFLAVNASVGQCETECGQ